LGNSNTRWRTHKVPHDPLLLTKPVGPENIVLGKDSFLLGKVHRATAFAGWVLRPKSSVKGFEIAESFKKQLSQM